MPEEIILAFIASLSAGFTEEIIYRGYLQQSLNRWLGNPWLAIALQAEAFAIAHTYEGVYSVAAIAIESLLTGYLAYRLGNLRLVIAAHATVDFIVFMISLCQ
jgi:membrane protease YdiL (CAAX protease family)